MLQRRKIGHDLARITNLVELIPSPRLPMLQVLLPSAFFWHRLILRRLSQPSRLLGALRGGCAYSLINLVTAVLQTLCKQQCLSCTHLFRFFCHNCALNPSWLCIMNRLYNRVVHITMAKNQIQATGRGTLHFCSIRQLYYSGKLSASCFTWKAVLSDHIV